MKAYQVGQASVASVLTFFSHFIGVMLLPLGGTILIDWPRLHFIWLELQAVGLGGHRTARASNAAA